MIKPLFLTLSAAVLCLTGCEQLGIEDPVKAAARNEADSKAIGAACRHAGRAIEDCYTLNQEADKAAVFAGWKEMNDYMIENKIAEVPPVLPPPESKEEKKKAAQAEAAERKKAEKVEKEHKEAEDDLSSLPPSQRILRKSREQQQQH